MSDPETADVLRACTDYIHALTRTLKSDGSNAAHVHTLMRDVIARTATASEGTTAMKALFVAELEGASRAAWQSIDERNPVLD